MLKRLWRKISFSISREKLWKLKVKAVRRGVWFRALSRTDRLIVDLTLKVVDGVNSLTLANSLLSVMRKLEETLENGVLNALKTVGFPLARRLSLLAQRWSNKFAQKWMRDVSFARFLAVIHINNPGETITSTLAIFQS